jgi:hypothetical protein
MDAAGGLFGGEDFGRPCLSGPGSVYRREMSNLPPKLISKFRL